MISKIKTLKKIKADYKNNLDIYTNGKGTVISATDDAMRLSKINRLALEYNSKRYFWQRPLKELRVIVW